jgi:phosphoribosylformimino-5-aminoimidazole carboxamide ribotide isomerase
MILYPAMDLMGERVVRLRQGRFEEATTYSADPGEALRSFADAGAEWAHIVDLDGARAGTPVQHELIQALASSARLKLQVGGGIRTRGQLAHLLDAGVERVIVGSIAVKQPDLLRDWVEEFGSERLVMSLDVRVEDGTPMVALSGWTEQSGLTLWDAAALHPGIVHLLLTDIGRDGMLAGPNHALLDEAVDRLPNLKIQASGGVTSLADLERLRTDGAIVGKALWEGRMSLEEALDLARA